MRDLVLIADDLTGALDASVPFASAGVEVVVSQSPALEVGHGANRLPVMSINADSRHLEPLGAYMRVSAFAEAAVKSGVRAIFKKTDSVLRGNVGAELEAVWENAGEGCLHFIPAWPSMGRTTKDGIQYVDGVPISESYFGHDPFDPVRVSRVKDIIAVESDVPTVLVHEQDDIPWGFKGIAIYDATTDEAISHRVEQIVGHDDQITLLAGCAGIARGLASGLGLDEGKVSPSKADDPRMLVFCGSVSETSARQCAFAKRSGASYFELTDDEKLDGAWLESGAGQQFSHDVLASWDANSLTIIDGSPYDPADGPLEANDARGIVATNLGHILQTLAREGAGRTVLVIGGDALQAFLEQLAPDKVRLVGEVSQGVVETEVTVSGKPLRVLSKSGGFGNEDLIIRLSQKTCQRKEHFMMELYGLKLPKAVWSGNDPTSKIPEILAGAGATKVCLFTDKGLRKMGLTAEAEQCVKDAGCELVVVDDIPAEPAYAVVQGVADESKATGADYIIAIGGGSVMDTAKLASVLATDEYTVKDLLDDPKQAHKQVKTLMIPTTAGTGSEATPNAIVLVPEEDLKVGIVNDDLIADDVILEDKMIKNLPRSIAAGTGIDALCHAIECFTSTKANPLSDTFALEALDLILHNIEKACDDPAATDAKRAMQLASFYAGIAITAAGTTAVHALSYPLGGRYHVPHGVSNAILLVPVMRFNEPATKERLARAYDRCALGDATTADQKADALIDLLDSIVQHLDIPSKLAGLGVDDPDVDFLVESGMKVQRLLVNNMREVTPDDARAIYQQII